MNASGPTAAAAPVRAGAIADLLRPGSVAIVGASDRSTWSVALQRNLSTIGGHRLWLVNPNRPEAHGQATVPSLAEIDGDVQLACLIVRAEQVTGALLAAAERGIRNVIVIASGFQEAGADGAKRAAELRDIAAAHGITVLGPNTSGMINVASDYAPFGSFLDPPLVKGGVGIVLQSGGLASQVVRLSQARGIGISAVVATGNESVVTTSAAIEHFVDDEGTTVVAAFLEDVKDVTTFRRAALRAIELGKPIVALKVGRTPAGRKAALSHTGAVVGDDAGVDAAFRQLGVIRVRTLEELLGTAGLMAGNRPITGRRMGVLAPSGGFCDLIADGAGDAGLELPDFSPTTVDTLTELLPYYGAAKNPLDVTGMIVSDRSIAVRALGAICRDERLDFVLYPSPLPYTRDDSALDRHRPTLEHLAALAATSPIPVVLQAGLPTDITFARRQILAEHGLYASVGIDVTLTALGAAAGWHERRRAILERGLDSLRDLGDGLGRRIGGRDETLDGFRAGGRPGAGPVAGDARDAGVPWSEAAARVLLVDAGVPVVPGAVATDPAGAERIAEQIAEQAGSAVAVKVVAAALAHKSDVGGVELGLTTPAEAGAAFERVTAKGRAAGAAVEGALVTAMRTGGAEVLASVTVDPKWGPMLTVGLGGIWVEALGDTSSRMLPVTHAEIVAMLGELRGARLLSGRRRDGQTVDIDRLAAVIERIAAAALGLGPRLHTVEINPIWARGTDVEVLDALILTTGAGEP